ncbi:MAG: PIN domain-containing protein [Phycisphaerae bacterium]
MDEYLIDTNVLFDMMNAESADSKRVWAARRARKAVLHLPVIALGETQLGFHLGGTDLDAARRDLDAFLDKNGLILQQVTKHTAQVYARIKASLIEKYSPKKTKHRAKWPETWRDPVTGAELGVDECDLWIVAQAIERNLVLVTADRMERLREVIKELRVENWRVASGP